MAEFSKKQMALIDANRDYNIAHDWWEDTYDFFIEAASEFGLCVTRDDIEFSGFWSQGDGANFNFEPLLRRPPELARERRYWWWLCPTELYRQNQ